MPPAAPVIRAVLLAGSLPSAAFSRADMIAHEHERSGLLRLGNERSLGLAPAPLWHRGLAALDRGGLRRQDRDPRSPFDVGHQSRAELRIAGQANFVRALEQ